MTPEKTIVLTIWTFMGKVMPLSFSRLWRFLIAFLLRNKHLLILWFQSPSTVILELKKIKSVIVSTFSPSICYEVVELDAMILAFWMLSLKPVFFILLFHLHQDSFSSSFLYAISVVSSLYLRLLMFLLAILIPACASSSLAFCMMYSAYRLNKQGDITQPWGTPFSILNQTIVPCLVLTVASWPAYRVHRREVRWSGTPISLRIFHSLLWHTQRLYHSQ